MTPFLVAAPSVEPVSVELLKRFLRIEGTAEDELLAALCVAARQWIEAYTGRALVTQSWGVFVDREKLRGREIVLPKAPLQSVSEIAFYADDDTEAVWSAGNYYVDVAREPGRIVLRSGAVWPLPTREANGIKITYRAGYGDSAEDVPDAILLAMKQLVAAWYEHRGDEAEEVSVPSLIVALLAPYRILHVGGGC